MPHRITRPSLCKLASYLQRVHSEPGGRILDCGAGGRVPPLAMLHEHGFECYGIDISDEQVKHAREFCDQHGIDLRIEQGDMRSIPFEDGFFDCVYECESMCHLVKSDLRLATSEMRRTVKKGGHCFMMFLLLDSVPLMGRDSGNGELTSVFDGEEFVHSYFEESEPESYLDGFEIVGKEKRTVLFNSYWVDLSMDDWMEWFSDDWTHYTRDEWAALFDKRQSSYSSSIMEYILKKQ